MNKGDTFKLTIEDMLSDGRGFGRHDGMAVFVNGGVIGDVIQAGASKVKKNAVEAKLIKILEPSSDRVEPECPYAGQCGGCSMQELSYSAQLTLKEKQIADKLARLGGIEAPLVRPIIAATQLDGYRNKATFALGPHGEVGFLKNKSHFVMDIEDCMLQSEAAMACAAALREFVSGKPSCIKQMIVKTAHSTGEVLVALESEKKEIPGIESLIELLDEYVYNLGIDEAYYLESVSVICNNKCRIVAGKNTIIENVTTTDGVNLQFEISPQSFYQVNPQQMLQLYAKAMEYADLKGSETFLDLYCGVGTIGIFAAAEMLNKLAEGKLEGDLATASVKYAEDLGKVIGIESVKPAVLDANRNSVINGIINTRYICGKAEDELPAMVGLSKLYKYNEVNELVEREPDIKLDKVNVALVDPPRAGCEPALLDAIVKTQPDRIVYVSCDPGTLARDVKYLEENGYRFVEATPVDMFPWTSHVECVSLMSRIN